RESWLELVPACRWRRALTVVSPLSNETCLKRKTCRRLIGHSVLFCATFKVMRRSFFFVTAGLLCSSILAASQTVEGNVVNSRTGAGIAGVKVAIVQMEKTVYST